MIGIDRERQDELFAKAKKRLRMLGADNAWDMVILQEDEIERYRNEIEWYRAEMETMNSAQAKRAEMEAMNREPDNPADGDLVGELLEELTAKGEQMAAQTQSAIRIGLPENVREINVKELHIALK